MLEVGLGGRVDTTNVIPVPEAAVITRIGLEHTELLGDTIEKITHEKCGILRDCPVVTSPNQAGEALNVIQSYTDRLTVPDLKECEILKSDITGNTFIYKGERFEISLAGCYQVENALTAIETVKNSGYNIPYNILYKGLKNTFFPARMEVISKNPIIVLIATITDHITAQKSLLNIILLVFTGRVKVRYPSSVKRFL